MRLHVEKWNKRDNEKTMFILSEKMIQENDMSVFKGAGIDILVIPNKYKSEHNLLVSEIIEITKHRLGEIIYV